MRGVSASTIWSGPTTVGLGKVVGSVSKRLSYLVVGENPGSKAARAAELGIKTADWDTISRMLTEDHD